MRVLILGAGGHSRSLISHLKRDLGSILKWEIWDYGPSAPSVQEKILGEDVRFVGPRWTDHLEKEKFDQVYLAIGDAKLRQDAFEKVRRLGQPLPSYVSKTSTVHDSASIGSGTLIFDRCYVGPLSRLGENVLVNTGAILEHESQIGSHTTISPGSILCGRTRIGNGVTIGAGAIIRENLSIHENASVGMGAVVLRSISDSETHVGLPAKKMERGPR